eukprot:1328750-Pleurochrysis_carterae.AAC.1
MSQTLHARDVHLMWTCFAIITLRAMKFWPCRMQDHEKRDDASETGHKKLVIPTSLKGYGEVKFRK